MWLCREIREERMLLWSWITWTTQSAPPSNTVGKPSWENKVVGGMEWLRTRIDLQVSEWFISFSFHFISFHFISFHFISFRLFRLRFDLIFPSTIFFSFRFLQFLGIIYDLNQPLGCVRGKKYYRVHGS